MEREINVPGRRAGRLKQLVDEFKEMKGYRETEKGKSVSCSRDKLL